MKRYLLIALMLVPILLTTTTVYADDGCVDTGYNGLTSHFINEVPTGELDVTCDIGVYFDEPGIIDSVTINGTISGAKSKQYGVYVNGASVDIVNSTFVTEPGYTSQMVPILYENGATGTIKNNSVTGAHRSGIVIRGEDTNVLIDGNEVVAIGPKSSGWAQNGIQIDTYANANVKNNLIEGHVWVGSDWAGSGLVIWNGAEVNAGSNTLINNEVSVYIDAANDNKIRQNSIEITSEPSEIGYWGMIVLGDNNLISQNSLTSTEDAGYVGIYIYGINNKLIRNSVSGWDFDVYDGGSQTIWPKPFQ